MERFIIACFILVASGLTLTGLWSLFGPQKDKPHPSIPIMMLAIAIPFWLACFGALNVTSQKPPEVRIPNLP